MPSIDRGLLASCCNDLDRMLRLGFLLVLNSEIQALIRAEVTGVKLDHMESEAGGRGRCLPDVIHLLGPPA